MTVNELIWELKRFPREAKVGCVKLIYDPILKTIRIEQDTEKL